MIMYKGEINMEDNKEITLDDFIKTNFEDWCVEEYIVNYMGFKMKGMVSNQTSHHLWTIKDTTTIYSWEKNLNKDELLSCIEIFKNGKEACNICHKMIEDNPEYCFAGVYCKKCFHKHHIDEDKAWDYSHLD